MDIRLTAAQERILRYAVKTGAYHLFGPRRRSCDKLVSIGLLRGFCARGETKPFLYLPTDDGTRWVKQHKEPS